MELERKDNGDVGPMVERLTVTVEEATVMLGISRTTAYGCASTNEIPTVRLGRRVVVPTAALMAMLAGDGQPARRREDDKAAGTNSSPHVHRRHGTAR